MNILDENTPRSQLELLKSWRIPIRQIGYDIGYRGMTDEEIIPFLLKLTRPTLFTRDLGFFGHNLCHHRYSLVSMDIGEYDVAVFVRRLLRHNDFRTQAKRMGTVMRISQTGLLVWRLHTESEVRLLW